MTQEELAEKMSVTAQAVSKWERDASYPDITAIPILAKVLGVSVTEIIEGAQEAPEIREAAPDVIDRRIISIKVKVGETYVTARFPVTAMKKAIENGMLKQIVGEDAFTQVAGAFEMVDLGLTGPLVTVDDGDTNIRITVENHEG